MSSLQELIDLAKRTGDRLIIHDPYTERNMVVMDVDQYKELVTGHRSVRNLSSREMVEKINRELAIWRSNHEQEEREELAMVLHDELEDVPAFDPFENITEPEEDEWYQVGDVMQAEFPGIAGVSEESHVEQNVYTSMQEAQDAASTIEEVSEMADEPPMPEEEQEVEEEDKQELRYEFPVVEPEMSSTPSVRETPFMPRPVPRMRMDKAEEYTESESAGDTPVFFEEPI